MTKQARTRAVPRTLVANWPATLGLGAGLALLAWVSVVGVRRGDSASTVATTQSEATAASEGFRDDDIAIYPAFAKKMLASRLRDPDSARIVDLMAFKTGDKLTLCGSVNAKDGFGGYNGPEPFIVSDNGVFVGEAEATGDRVFAECKGAATAVVPVSMLRN